MSVHESIAQLRADMRAEGIVQEEGLGQELFHFASSLMPVVNVDLLVFNSAGEVLLSWRDDAHCGRGWHVPGGCLRLGETFARRIQKTAQAEFGTSVRHAPKPAGVFELFTRYHRDGLEDQRECSHFITLPFACVLMPGSTLRMAGEIPGPGDLRWFADLPGNLLKTQSCYWTDWTEIYKAAWRDYNGILEE